MKTLSCITMKGRTDMNIVKIEIKRQLKTLLIWAAVCIGLHILFMAFFPSMKNSGMSELISAKISAIPKSFAKSMGITSLLNFSDLLQYFAYVYQFIFMAVCIFASMLGANALIKEESEGTIEFLYSKPVSRIKIAVSKMASTFIIIFILNILLYISSVIMCFAFAPDGYKFMASLSKISFGTFYGSLAFWAVGFLFSALLKNVSEATPAALGLFFVTYLLGVFSDVIDKLSWMKYLSPYHYVLPADILKNGSASGTYAFLIAVIIVSCLILTAAIYKRKDYRL